jgi:hypothetical protein
MDQVAFIIEKNVSIVPVLDLDEVGHHAIGSTTFDKIPLGGKELFRVGRSKLIVKVAQQPSSWRIGNRALLLHLNPRKT